MTSVYGVDVSAWPAWRRALAWDDLPAVIANGRLLDPDYAGSLTSSETYDLALAATRSEYQARKYAQARADARMLAGKEP